MKCQVIRFADRVAAAGMTVFCPSLFGDPGRPATLGYALATIAKAICVRREFDVWARDRSSPIVDWLRALAAFAHAQCGGRGVGAVGMCFTGNFALAMMTEPSVVAPVLSQPSLPLGGPGAAAIGLSSGEITCAKNRLANEDLSIMALRFFGDPVVPDARFDSLKREFGARLETIEIDPKDARSGTGLTPHSVLTIHLDDGDPTGPTKQAEERVIAFFKARTAA
jgi:dienelactone hydrolase